MQTSKKLVKINRIMFKAGKLNLKILGFFLLFFKNSRKPTRLFLFLIYNLRVARLQKYDLLILLKYCVFSLFI